MMEPNADPLALRRLDQARQAAQMLYRHGARRVWLFGSLARGAETDRRTDIDLAVEGLAADRIWALVQTLRNATRCKVDIVDIESATPHLRREILATRIPIADSAAPGIADTPLPAPASEEDSAGPRRPVNLHRQRQVAALAVLRREGVRSVLDLGCGGGVFLESLAAEPQFERLTGVDLSREALEAARRRLGLEPDSSTGRVRLLHALATNPDPRFLGHEGVTAIEVVEHLDPARLKAFGRVVFSFVRPRVMVLTTPNAEYNALWQTPDAEPEFRHRDHRFEWTRAEFRDWAAGVASAAKYRCEFQSIGTPDAQVGPPTQMAIWNRRGN